MNVKSSAPAADRVINGDFSRGSLGWSEYQPVNFDNERCNIGPNGLVTQIVNDGPTGRYRFSCDAAVVAAGADAHATFSLHVNGVIFTIDIKYSAPTFYYGDLEIPAGAEVTFHILGNSDSVWIDNVKLDVAPDQENMILNGDFSQGSTHWDCVGAVFDGNTCLLREQNGVSQTVFISQGGYYQLNAWSRAGNGSSGRVRVDRLPQGESQFSWVLPGDWVEHDILLEANQGETGFVVTLLREKGDDLEFDDISLTQFIGYFPLHP